MTDELLYGAGPLWLPDAGQRDRDVRHPAAGRRVRRQPHQVHVPRARTDGRLRGHGDDRRPRRPDRGLGRRRQQHAVLVRAHGARAARGGGQGPRRPAGAWVAVGRGARDDLRCARLLGCVTDGSVRDLDEARGMGFHFFAGGPSFTRVRARGNRGRTDRGRRSRVAPGDLIHADQHGVLKIPHEIAAELPAAADRVIETEQALLRWVRSEEFDPDRLAEMRARH